jgi:hypothetical protein
MFSGAEPVPQAGERVSGAQRLARTCQGTWTVLVVVHKGPSFVAHVPVKKVKRQATRLFSTSLY